MSKEMTAVHDSESKCYAIVPAAGRSLRMGRSKLLLPWPSEESPNGTVIDAVLSAWTSSRVTETVVIVRHDDDRLFLACEQWPVTIVRPQTPPQDMKASVQSGLRYLENKHRPSTKDHCFIAPADLPSLKTSVINGLLESTTVSDMVAVPTFGGSRGHPALFPWPMTKEIFHLGSNEGVNAIVDRRGNRLVEFPSADMTHDIDTPEEYDESLRSLSRKTS